MPTSTKKPRVVIPSNPQELITLGREMGSFLALGEGGGSDWDDPNMIALGYSLTESGNRAQSHQSNYVAADNTKKSEREARDIDLKVVETNLKQLRDMAFAKITDGNYARLGELGFTVLVTEASSGGSGGSGSEQVDDNGDFVPAS